MIKFSWSILFTILLLLPYSSFACVVASAPRIKELNEAEIIFRGKLDSYKAIEGALYNKFSKRSGNYRIAKISFDVLEIYRGHLPKNSITAFWHSSVNTSPPSDRLQFVKRYENEILVGLAPPSPHWLEYIKKVDFGFFKTFLYGLDDMEEAYWVLQPTCDQGFILPAHSGIVDKFFKMEE